MVYSEKADPIPGWLFHYFGYTKVLHLVSYRIDRDVFPQEVISQKRPFHYQATRQMWGYRREGKSISAPGSGQWNYTATVQGQPVVKIQVVAVDRPGGTAVMNINKTF